MTEQEFAKLLEQDYLKAKKHFKNPNISHDLTHLENIYNLNYEKLKKETEKLGYNLILAKDIDSPNWQKIWAKGRFIVFYKNKEDLS